MTLSVIVPTCGRKTLRRALESVLLQLHAEVIVVGDGPQSSAERTCFALGVRYLDGPLTRCWGNTQRQVGMRHATGDYLLFLDDDDVMVPGALAIVREAIAEDPGRPLLCQFVDRNGAVIWRDRDARCGNVSTQCIAFPNVPGRLGTWGERYTGDHDFIVSTLSLYPVGSVVWRPNILQVAG